MRIRYEKSFDKLPSNLQEKINHSNVFYSENYRKYLQNKSSEVAFFYSDLYIMMVQITHKYIFKYANFPTEYIRLENKINITSENEFLNYCIDYLKNIQNVQWVNVTPASSFFLAYPKFSLRIPFGNYVINLTQSEEEIFGDFHTKHRNSVRKAEKSAVVIKYGHEKLLNDYMIIDNDTWRRSGAKGSHISYYRNIMKTLGENAVVFIAYKDDIPQGGAIFYYNKEMSYYMFGASKNQPESGSMNLLHWEAIKYMKSNGVKRYSFVGCRINEDEDSKYHDIQRFKKRFGGDLVTGYLFKVILKENYFKLFKFLVTLKNRSFNNVDVIDQELHKWPELEMNRE
ncbi:MAG: FemAB family protein [Firmicutes bacterium]|nr:FemAB family protein [Bacillota bacterium]